MLLGLLEIEGQKRRVARMKDINLCPFVQHSKTYLATFGGVIPARQQAHELPDEIRQQGRECFGYTHITTK